MVEAQERDADAIPRPIGTTRRHCAGSDVCASDSPVWGAEYEDALAAATERASIEAGDDDAAFRRLLRKYFSEHPKFGEWDRIERKCIADFRDHHARSRRKTATATSETLERVRDLERELGTTIRGSAAHFDLLSLGGRATYWRREATRTGSAHALANARAIEREMRRLRKGTGLRRR